MPSPLRLVQLTDMHLFADEQQQLLGLPTMESFRAVLQQVADLQLLPDLLLLTGDLSQDGQPESYKQLRDQIDTLGIPAYWLPGNHDCLPVMEHVLNQGMLSSQKSFQVWDWHVILLNSQVSGCVHGYLSQATLQWLDRELVAVGDRPTLIGLHHPPFIVGSDWLDGSTLQNPDDLFAVLDRHPQVKLVLSGHIHQDYSYNRRGVQYLGTPSTCIQFEPRSAAFSLDAERRPGFRVLELYSNGTWTSTVERTTYAHKPDFVATGY